jgi:hypothetical protein
MSNYLNRLLAKNLDVTETVQPRLPSLFEPLSGVPRLDMQSDFSLENSDVTVNSETRESEKRSRRSINTSPLNESQPETESFSLTDLPSNTPVETNNLVNSLTKTVNSVADKTNPIQPTPTPSELLRSIVVESKPGSSITPQVTEINNIQTGDRAALSKQISQHPLEHSKGFKFEQNLEAEVITPQASSKPRSNETLTIKPQITSAAERSLNSSHQSTPSTQPQPTIQVTIGRIEVRASSPPTPSLQSKPFQRSPTMSLEEYLRQRGGSK